MIATHSSDIPKNSRVEDLWQFVAISHDLKAPVRTIGRCADLLFQKSQRIIDTDTRRLVGQISEIADRMQTLIDDALMFGLANDMGASRARVDVKVALQFSIANLDLVVSEASASISNGSLPVITANFGGLVRIFQNLIENAIKYRAQNRPRIHVACSERAGHWIFSMADNGIGIAAEYHQDVFLPLKRLHSQQEYPGTGLGLAICRRIVESHGGRIWVESAPGKGSVFYFTIPQ